MSAYLQTELWGNTLQDYLKFVFCFAILLLIVFLVKHFLLKRLTAWAKRSGNEIEGQLVAGIRKYLMPLLFLGAFYFSLKFLHLSAALNKILNFGSLALITLLGTIFLSSVAVFLIYKCWYRRSEDSNNAHAVKWIATVAQILIWAVALILFLENTGAHINSLVTGLGIGGIAIAFAAQAVLADFFSFFSIFFDKPFEIGDFITVGDLSGTVENIGIKTIRLRSLSGEQLVLSNKDITSSRVRNYKRMEKRRVLFKIGVTYATKLPVLREIPGLIKEIIEQIPDTTFDRAHFSAFGEFSQNFEIVYYVQSGDYTKFMDIQQEINFKIREAFETRGIEFAFPTQTLHLARESGAPRADGGGKSPGGPVLL